MGNSENVRIGERLRLVRNDLGLTLQSVAERIGFSSYQTLSSIEKGERAIKVAELSRLCRLYHRDIDFFITQDEHEEPIIGMAWREPVGSDDHKVIEARIKKHILDYRLLEKITGDEPRQRMNLWPSTTPLDTYDDIESKADEVINNLKLGEPPAANLAQAMQEKLGINIIYYNLEGYSSGITAIDDTGVFVFINALDVMGRRNFDLAHELFHIYATNIFPLGEMGDGHTNVNPKLEQFANKFASCLLLPKAAVINDFKQIIHDNKFNVFELLPLAQKYKVSNIAFLWRLCNLGFIDHDTVKRIKSNALFKEKSASVRKSDFNPARLYSDKYVWMALEALRDGQISKGKFCDIFDIRRSEFTDFLAEREIAEEFLDEQEIQVNTA